MGDLPRGRWIFVEAHGGAPGARRAMRFALRGGKAPLFAVLAMALAARLVSLFALKGDLSIRVPLLDGLHYMTTATGLAHGEGWPPGPHFMAPIYPFLLSGLFRVAPASVVTVQAIQLVLGVLTAGLIYRTGGGWERRPA